MRESVGQRSNPTRGMLLEELVKLRRPKEGNKRMTKNIARRKGNQSP
jgi:hypothetical protein